MKCPNTVRYFLNYPGFWSHGSHMREILTTKYADRNVAWVMFLWNVGTFLTSSLCKNVVLCRKSTLWWHRQWTLCKLIMYKCILMIIPQIKNVWWGMGEQSFLVLESASHFIEWASDLLPSTWPNRSLHYIFKLWKIIEMPSSLASSVHVDRRVMQAMVKCSV